MKRKGLHPDTLARRRRADARRDFRDGRSGNGPGYAAFRTGLDYATVRQMMWGEGPDGRPLRQKHRNGVLGFWRELKLQLWQQQLDAESAPPEDDEPVPF